MFSVRVYSIGSNAHNEPKVLEYQYAQLNRIEALILLYYSINTRTEIIVFLFIEKQHIQEKQRRYTNKIILNSTYLKFYKYRINSYEYVSKQIL